MSKTILLADDSVTIQKVIELTFMDQDCEVIAVSTGDEAVSRLDEMEPALVIADVHMPGANGYEVARHSKDRFPGVPVLLLVGTFEPFDEGEMAASGADSHLKKPFDSQELLQLVNRLLESAATEADEPAQDAEPARAEPPTGPTPVPDAPAAFTPPAAPDQAPPSIGAETVRLDSLSPADLQGGEAAAAGDAAAETPDDVGQESVTWGNLDLEAVEEVEVELRPSRSTEVEAPADATPLSEQEADQSEPFRLSDPDSESFSLEPDTSEASEPEVAEPAPSQAEAPAAPAAVEIPSTGLSDEDVERIARRVAELVGEKAVKEVAWEVIPDLAEVVIKDRIQQLENQVK